MPIVRKRILPDVVIDKCTCRPTPESLEKVLAAISRAAGNGTRISAAYITDDNFDAMLNYAKERMNQNSDPNREPYKILSNNCGHFMKETVDAGGVDTPMMIDPRPNSYIGQLQKDFQPIEHPAGGLEFLLEGTCDE